MSNSKNNSTSNLNESNMPLLSGEDKLEKTGETPEKESIHLEIELQEKEDSGNEKSSDVNSKVSKKHKSKDSIKKPCYVDVLSHNMDINNRDAKSINEEINIGFDDVLAEPLSSHGFDWIWKLSYVLFSQTKLLAYRLLAGIIAIPASLIWGLIFALLTVIHVWILAPLLKIFDFIVAILRKIIMGLMRVTIEPISSSIGLVFSNFSIHHQKRNISSEP